jgi:predicted transcriptional regulator
VSVIRGWLDEEKWFYFICCMKDLHVGVGWMWLLVAGTTLKRRHSMEAGETLMERVFVSKVSAELFYFRSITVTQTLSAWLEQGEERERLTREALADVDAGLVIDHQAVQAWAESLGKDNPLAVPG